LAAARLPEAETVFPPRPTLAMEQGVPLADLVDVVNYWRTGYNWRSFEERPKPDRPVPHAMMIWNPLPAPPIARADATL